MSARSAPIQQVSGTPPLTGFIRSLTSDTPIATSKPVVEHLDIERMIEMQFKREIDKVERSADPEDHVSFDVPLLIRVFELVREGIKSDVELHELVERLIGIRKKGVLTMEDYNVIAGGNIEGTTKEYAPKSIAAEPQGESIDMLRKLAGLR